MIILLTFKILLISTHLHRRHIGLCIGRVSIFRFTDILIKSIERYSFRGSPRFIVLSKHVFHVYKVVTFKAYFVLSFHTRRTGMTSENIPVIQQSLCLTYGYIPLVSKRY